MISFNDTPIEKHIVEKKVVYVKREDLCANKPMPPLSKLRGIYEHLKKYKKGTIIGVCDTRVSKSGAGVACICKELDLKCYHYFPLKKDEETLNENRRMSKESGAVLKPLQASALRFVYMRAKKDVESKGGVMLPHGLPFYETVKETVRVLENIDKKYLTGTIILTTGTGTIMSGIICGLLKRDILPRRIIGISAGMSIKKQRILIDRHTDRFYVENHSLFFMNLMRNSSRGELLKKLELYHSERDYYDGIDFEIPFPAHPNYEGKTWEWLLENINEIEEPILFWNIGS